MTTSLTFNSILVMFAVMVMLAMIPGVSVLAVTTRAATSGFLHGAATAVGIVAGDIAFILIAIYGLSALADIMDSRFVIVKVLGGTYLIWLGISHWLTKPAANERDQQATSSLSSSFLAGLIITLADQKAILFYLGFFPAFIDLAAVTLLDIAIISVITVVAVGGTKLVYAFMAHRAGAQTRGAYVTLILKRLAAVILVGIGIYLLAGTWQHGSSTQGSEHDYGTYQGRRHLVADHAGCHCQWPVARGPA